MDPELTQLEKELAELQPAGLSDSFIEKIEQAIADDIEQQKEAKVVLFPHRRRWLFWGQRQRWL